METTQNKAETQPLSNPVASSPRPVRNTSHPSVIGSIAFILSLLSLAILIALGWYFFTIYNKSTSSLDTFKQQQQATTQELQTTINDLQSQVNQQQALLANLQQLSNGNKPSWRFSEAKYLVQLAYYHLTFTHDVRSALALLQTAEQRIASINDPTLVPIQQDIENSIVALQGVPQVDLAHLLTRITALQTQAPQLPAIGLPSFKSVEESEEQADDQSPLRQAIHQSWVTLQKIVVIRHQDTPISPLLSPEQQAYLQQNLQLILQQAQWAALRGQEDVYQSSLQHAQEWVDRYFAKNLPATQAFVQDLNTLQKVNVQPPLPDLAPLASKMQRLTYNPAKQDG